VVAILEKGGEVMAKWEIRQTVEYWAEGIEAETEEEAFKIYLENQDMHYYGVESEEITRSDDDEDMDDD